MITEVGFENFKALRNVSISLERFTVFVGPNASGKTSILQGLHCLSRLGSSKCEDVFSGRLQPSVVQTRGTRAPIQLRMFGQWDNGPGGIAFSTDPLAFGGQLGKGRWVIQGVWGGEVFEFSEKLLTLSERQNANAAKAKSLAQAVKSAVLLRFDPQRLAEPSHTDSPSPRVEDDGYGLASVLAHLTLTRPEDANSLQQAIRSVVPGFKLWRLPPTAVHGERLEGIDAAKTYRLVPYTQQGYEIVADFDEARGIAAHSLSEGTLLVIGLLTVMMAPSRPRLLLIDNIERGLHPKATGEFIGQIRKMLELYEDLQIVATTHSPYLLDHLDPKEIRLTMVDPEAGVSCAPMTEHPEFDKWKDQMGPGEFWSLIGEDWIKTHHRKDK